MTTLAQAAEQMLAAGMPNFPDGLPIGDGRIHRYGKKKRAWYRLRELPRRNGGTFIAGHFGVWGQIERTKIVADFSGIDDAERARLRDAWAKREDADRRRRAAQANYAAERAEKQWKAARAELPADARCPYLEKKAIVHENGAFRYFVENCLATLVVPMRRYDEAERLVGLQKIAPDGVKLFNRGTDPRGAACVLGKLRDGAPILFVEGLATGGSIRQAIEREHAVVVCFTAGNLLAAARIFRKLYPASPFLFCADDDAYLEAQLNARLRGDFDAWPQDLYRVDQGERLVGRLVDKRDPAMSSPELLVRATIVEDERGVAGLTGFIEPVDGPRRTFGIANAGRTKANEAQTDVGNAWICWPRFKARELSPDPDAARLTDFNDLHKAEGLEAVRAQLLEALSLILVPAKRNVVEMAAERARREAERKQRDEKRKKREEEKEKEKAAFVERLDKVFSRFILIYPSREAWDCKTEEIVKLEHIGALYGSEFVDSFTHSPRKRVIHAEDVVFDPSGKIDQLEDGRVNLFRGLELEPDPDGDCSKLLALLNYLCNEDGDVMRWVLRWLALPLQRLGTKMATAIVMHGEEEGTGKNLFFSAIAEIYGRHGGFITQRELESSFNTWQSAKLFMVANEVVTRAEMRHQAGYLRHLITEPTIWINAKNLQIRQEANHMNVAFLSNENQALLVPRHDRRFTVIRTPGPLPEDRYQEVVAELRNGGAAALYDYLLKLDLGDFHAHTKPIETQAKRELIEIGLASPHLFWQDLHDGEFPLPYMPCLREDLYRAYLAWCARNGEKMPKRINQFMPEFRSMNGVRYIRERVNLDGGPRQRRICVMGEPTQGVAEKDWIEAAVKKFRQELTALTTGYSGGEP